MMCGKNNIALKYTQASNSRGNTMFATPAFANSLHVVWWIHSGRVFPATKLTCGLTRL